ncbi:MAG: YlxR family protein [Proteobacteria bacterium]|nr:YlxR family protein [Pseudomonadota bacterium]
MAERRAQLRTCVGCRQRRPRSELLRWVVDGGGRPRADLRRRARGRGAHSCAQPECLRRALARGALGRALKAPLLGAEFASLQGELLRALGQQRNELLRQCIRDGRAQARQGLRDGRARARASSAESPAGLVEGTRVCADDGGELWLLDARATARIEQWDRWTRALAGEPSRAREAVEVGLGAGVG